MAWKVSWVRCYSLISLLSYKNVQRFSVYASILLYNSLRLWDRCFMTTTKPQKPRAYGQDKARTNIRLLPETKERLVRAKEKLHMSETACIEAALRLWFRKEEIQ